MNNIKLPFSQIWLSDLEVTLTDTVKLYSTLTEKQGNYKYAEKKWTLKQLLEHLIDCEKIFNYRALRFSKKDTTELASFDENNYVINGNASNHSLHLLIEEYKLTRLNSFYFFGKLSDEERTRKGISNGKEMSVEEIALYIAKHNQHHLKIIKERYLPLL